jgi:hypothetical protein
VRHEAAPRRINNLVRWIENKPLDLLSVARGEINGGDSRIAGL